MGSGGDNSLDETIDGPAAGALRAPRRPRYRLVAPYPGVERTSTSEVPGAWNRGSKIAFILGSAVAAWGLALVLFRLISRY